MGGWVGGWGAPLEKQRKRGWGMGFVDVKLGRGITFKI